MLNFNLYKNIIFVLITCFSQTASIIFKRFFSWEAKEDLVFDRQDKENQNVLKVNLEIGKW